MEKLIKRYNSLVQALATIQESLGDIQKPEHKAVYKGLRDSVIQRFEYTIDMFWKFMKLYLQEKHSVEPEVPTPRVILRNALIAKVIEREELDVLLRAIGNRNLTSHSYNEDTAEEIFVHRT